MLRFLFWNLGRKPLASLAARVAADRDVDVVILAEVAETTPEILAALNRSSSRPRLFHHAFPDECEKVKMFARFDQRLVRPLSDSTRVTMRELLLPGRASVIVGGVHLASKLFTAEIEQAQRSTDLVREITAQETKTGHTRTVIVGDFNMNPFELGMAGAYGFNAVMTANLARRGSRRVESVDRPFFYNPMWNHFGDRGPNPPGTYYYSNSPHLWNMFDQVLIRPALVNEFLEDQLLILTEIGSSRTRLLTKRKLPDSKTASDHLPLLFALTV